MRPKSSSIAIFAILLLATILSAGSSPAAPDAAYKESFEKWRNEMTEDLRQNWLSLAGLFWLKPGANTFGSDPSNALVFPKGPAHAGEFDLEGKDVTVKLLADAHAEIDGNPAITAKLDPDISRHPTRVDMGSLRFHVIVRGERVGVRVRDTDSAEARDFKGMMFYPLDLNYRVTAKWMPSDGKSTVEVPNVLGDVSAEPIPGIALFSLNGQELRLTALGGDATTGYFFVFNDLTARSDTYPGGRFLDSSPLENGTVVLDFNRAYNPPCAVTPYATCPLAPKENRLPAAITAGEKFDKVAHAHMQH